jgi:hypothetical protein
MPVRNAGFGGIGASAEGGAHGPLNINKNTRELADSCISEFY